MEYTHQYTITDRVLRYIIRSYHELTDLEITQAIEEFQAAARREPVSIPDRKHVTHHVFIDLPAGWKFREVVGGDVPDVGQV